MPTCCVLSPVVGDLSLVPLYIVLPPLGQAVFGAPVAQEDHARRAVMQDALIERLVAKAAGNPFFLEELMWHAREQGPTHAPRAAPETVTAVLSVRIDRLSREGKHLLQCAAVVGTEVPLALLQAIAELSDEALLLGLAHLQAAEFLVGWATREALHDAGSVPRPRRAPDQAEPHEAPDQA